MASKLDDLDSNNSGGDFGYVNYKTLLLFHPRMKVYNFKVNNFYRPVPKDIKVPLKYYLEDRERRSAEQIKSSRTTHENYKRNLTALYRDKARVIANFKEQKRLLLRDKFADQDAELIVIAGKEDTAIAEVRSRIQSTKKQMKDLYNKSFGIHYLKLDERREEFKRIEFEVKQAIETIRSKQKLIFVLNNQVGDLKGPEKPNPRMFNYTGFVDMNSLWKFFHRSSVLRSGELNESRLENDINEMLGYYNRHVNVGSIFQLPSLSKFVLAGGRDITLHCLAEIYSRYKYPRKKVIRLINILAELDKGGAE